MPDQTQAIRFTSSLPDFARPAEPGNRGTDELAGPSDAHWRWRCTDEMLHSPTFQRLRDVTATSNRLHAPQRQPIANQVGAAM